MSLVHIPLVDGVDHVVRREDIKSIMIGKTGNISVTLVGALIIGQFRLRKDLNPIDDICSHFHRFGFMGFISAVDTDLLMFDAYDILSYHSSSSSGIGSIDDGMLCTINGCKYKGRFRFSIMWKDLFVSFDNIRRGETIVRKSSIKCMEIIADDVMVTVEGLKEKLAFPNVPDADKGPLFIDRLL